MSLLDYFDGTTKKKKTKSGNKKNKKEKKSEKKVSKPSKLKERKEIKKSPDKTENDFILNTPQQIPPKREDNVDPLEDKQNINRGVKQKGKEINVKKEHVRVLLKVDYSGERNKAYVGIYEDGKMKYWYDNTGHKPFLYTRISKEKLKKDYPAIFENRGFDHLEEKKLTDLIIDKVIPIIKVIAKDPLSIGGKRNSLRDIIGTKAWEARIRYHNCYIYDNALIPGLPYYIDENDRIQREEIKISADFRKELLDRFKDEPPEFQAFLPSLIDVFFCPIPPISRVAIDIEVSSEPNKMPSAAQAKESVICVSFAGTDNFKRVLTLRREGVEEGDPIFELDTHIEYFDDERSLLLSTFRTIDKFPVVLTFNGDNFDFLYLYNRAVNLGIDKKDIPITLGREITLLKNGVHVDLYRFFQNRAIKISAFRNAYRRNSLDEISQQLLKHSKIAHPDKEIFEMTYNELSYYCLRDSELTLELTTFDDDLVMNLIILLMRISKLSIEDLTRQGISSWLQNLFYWEHRQRNYLIPNPDYILGIKGEAKSTAIIKGKKYQGAIVIEPKPGIYFNVAVLDFASLYPSIIKRYNLSYETVNCLHDECRKNLMPGTNYWICTRRVGVMSLVIGLLKELRVRWFKPKSKDKTISELERRFFNIIQFTLKVIVNASYGVFGFAQFPLYCPPVADSTTAGGRYAIEQTKKKAESMGITVLYGDTDSVFLLNPTKEAMDEIVRWSSEELKMDLEVEKIFRYVALSSRKKNYFGVYQDGTVDIKGLSGKKSNTPPYIQKAFYKMIDILSEVHTEDDFDVAKDKIRKLLRVVLKKLKNKQIPKKELAFKVALTRPLDGYVKTTPQHVKAARMLEKHGKKVETGEFIEFLKTSDTEGVRPLELANVGDIDYNKYKDTVESVFEQVLDSLNIDFNELTGSKSLEFFM